MPFVEKRKQHDSFSRHIRYTSIGLFYLFMRSNSGSLGCIPNKIVQEETYMEGSQLLWCVVWDLCDGNLLAVNHQHLI